MKTNKWFTNYSPKQLSLLTAIVCLLFLAFILVITISILDLAIPYYGVALFLAICFVAFYAIIRYISLKYLHRKIKVLYKMINRSRISDLKAEEAMTAEGAVFDKVEEDINDWLAKRENELEELQSLESYRRNYIGNVSHELKTPIFNVQGFIHTLLDGALYDDKINKSYLLKAAKNISRLETIVEDLDAISRLESGKLILDIQTFDIRKLAEEVFEELELQAAGKNIILTFKETARGTFQVMGDKESIRQVLNNLTMNSIKYGKVGGKTKIGFYDLENQVLIEVADDGIGIEEKHLRHVFDRFYRVDKSRSRIVGGSGLGLSIVKHIIEAHNQSITVRSTLGEGTTFGFTLKKK